MLPVAVMPMNDPTGLMFPQLEAVTPLLKGMWGHVFVSVNQSTRQAWHERVQRVQADRFFSVLQHDRDMVVGEDFRALYAHAAAACTPDQIMHLCFIDRVAFALCGEHRRQFAADVQAVHPGDTPLIFQRSGAAWATHPQNYHELEQMVTRTGEFLFHTSLDFGWCHLAIRAQLLRDVLPHVRNRDISMVAEIPLLLRDQMHSKDVDWLAWEDPFILGRDAAELKREREQSISETHKRLAYVMPMLKLLDEAAVQTDQTSRAN